MDAHAGCLLFRVRASPLPMSLTAAIEGHGDQLRQLLAESGHGTSSVAGGSAAPAAPAAAVGEEGDADVADKLLTALITAGSKGKDSCSTATTSAVHLLQVRRFKRLG